MFQNSLQLLLAILALAVIAQARRVQHNLRGPRGFAGAAANLYVDRTVFVDSVFGSDATGQVEQFNKPFQTINAAFAAAAVQIPTEDAVWQVQVRPGFYDEGAVYLRSCINLSGSGPEVVINGTITDFPHFTYRSPCQPQLSNFAIQATNSPGLSFVGSAASVVAQEVDIVQHCSAAYTFLHGGQCNAVFHAETNVVFEDGSIEISSPGASAPFATAFATVQVSNSVLLSTPEGSGYQVQFFNVLGDSSYTSSIASDLGQVFSHNNQFQLLPTINSTGNVTVFGLSGATAIGLSDQLRLSLLGRGTEIDVLALGDLYTSDSGPESQSLDVADMLVDLDRSTNVARKVGQFYTLLNHGDISSSGRFNNLRLVGWDRPVPTQDVQGIGNTFLETNTLTDVYQGGQDLLQTRFFYNTTHVGDTDAILIWNGTRHHSNSLFLPSARLYPGRQVTLKMAWFSSAQGLKSITLVAASGDSIENASSLTLNPALTLVTPPAPFVTVVSDGLEQWVVVGYYSGA